MAMGLGDTEHASWSVSGRAAQPLPDHRLRRFSVRQTQAAGGLFNRLHRPMPGRRGTASNGPASGPHLLLEKELRRHEGDGSPRHALGHQARRPRAAVQAGEAHCRLGAAGGPAPGRSRCELLVPLLQAALAHAALPARCAGDCAHAAWLRGWKGRARAGGGARVKHGACKRACNRRGYRARGGGQSGRAPLPLPFTRRVPKLA